MPDQPPRKLSRRVERPPNSPPEPEYTRHLFEYRYQGSRWSFTIMACSQEDALARLEAMQNAIWNGSHAEEYPASLGWLVKAAVWWRNLRYSFGGAE